MRGGTVYLKNFRCAAKAEKAILKITALGVYEAKLNGERVGDFILAPGWTSYLNRLQVQSYDVTNLLKTENSLEVTVGQGWRAIANKRDAHRRADYCLRRRQDGEHRHRQLVDCAREQAEIYKYI